MKYKKVSVEVIFSLYLSLSAKRTRILYQRIHIYSSLCIFLTCLFIPGVTMQQCICKCKIILQALHIYLMLDSQISQEGTSSGEDCSFIHSCALFLQFHICVLVLRREINEVPAGRMVMGGKPLCCKRDDERKLEKVNKRKVKMNGCKNILNCFQFCLFQALPPLFLLPC